MPAYEQALSSTKGGSTNIGGGYSKLLAIFNATSLNRNAKAKSECVNIVLKESLDYEESLKSIDASGYNKVAGCDLSAIFMPFVTTSGSPIMPSFVSNLADNTSIPIRLQTLLPYQWNAQESGYLYLRQSSPSGDTIDNVVSANNYYGSTSDFRSVSDIRSIGLRLPLMLVGVGYDTEGNRFPASGIKYKGGYDYPYQVNPQDYVAAPADFRYDRTRNVWTMADERLYGKITNSTQDGTNKRWIYTFRQVEKTTAGYTGWSLKSGGESGLVYNFIEDINMATGDFGNGVNSTNLEAGFDIKPIPTNVIVLIYRIARTDNQMEYWTTYENGVDGSCA